MRFGMRNSPPRKLGNTRRHGLGVLLSLTCFAASSALANHSPVVLNETIEMVCFPPAAMQPPPCPVPVGIDPDLVAPDPSGLLHIQVRENDTARVSVRLSGMSPHQTATAWFVHYAPGTPPPHPIFAPTGPGQPPVANINTPLAHTFARYSEGLGPEPNGIHIRRNGRARLTTWLDYNPLKTGQVPLVNSLTFTQQGAAPAGSGAEQPTCCPDFPAGPRLEPVGGSYLRQFDPATGFQLVDEDGIPELLRSPARPVAVVVLIHTDGVTSGLLPGVPIAPFLVDPPITTGSVYLLGVFPIGSLVLE